MLEDLEKAINDGCRRIVQLQDKAGFFAGQVFSEDMRRTAPSPSVFPTALVLTALAPLKDRSAPAWRNMLQQGCNFLKGQRSEDGSFNYWHRQGLGKKRGEYPACPNDMDDTSLALAALALHDVTALEGHSLAQLVRMLTAIEHEEGGPYNTWLINFRRQPAWQDCDLAVNANIAYLLSLFKADLPNLAALFEKAIQANEFNSAYYKSPIIILYFILRSYRGQHSGRAKELVFAAKKEKMHWGSPLHTALALATLLRLEEDVPEAEQAITYLLATRNKTGGWDAEPFYLERSKGKNTWHGGSEAITTAFCLEALSLAQSRMFRNGLVEKGWLFGQLQDLQESAIAMFMETCTREAPALAPAARRFLEALLAEPFWSQSMVLPLAWKEAMGKAAASVSGETVFSLSVVHIFGLAAYHMADDIADGDVDPALVAFVNFALRKFTEAYARLLPGRLYAPIASILAGIEEAVYKESRNRLKRLNKGYDLSSLPARENLVCAEKSLGHAAPALALQFISGIDPHALAAQATLNFFGNFLAARQWNDDAHDLVEDLERGRVTPVSLAVLEAFKKRRPRAKVLEVRSHKQALRQIFWKEIFDEAISSIKKHLDKAGGNLKQIGLADLSYFENMLAEQGFALKRTIQERDRVLGFIQTYKTFE